jgi:hypothetical protein
MPLFGTTQELEGNKTRNQVHADPSTICVLPQVLTSMQYSRFLIELYVVVQKSIMSPFFAVWCSCKRTKSHHTHIISQATFFTHTAFHLRLRLHGLELLQTRTSTHTHTPQYPYQFMNRTTAASGHQASSGWLCASHHTVLCRFRGKCLCSVAVFGSAD